ncbi:Seipin [Tolypocladium ophioglossoides CBS 100239]|uniref:Seipin n=1 Tax=Tolypocladium ophioglossoides (strain CBS 100239) TaxID=1163406 RepID=A0A0L0N9F1_TOLOC|nr:Seipin [Tolypocladium ophioglossoides CBS 100239]
MDTLEETVRVVTSKPVQRAVVNTALLVSSAVTLFCLAAIATGLFFQNFVPDQFVTTPVHLQYGSGPNPYGVASLAKPPMIKTQQEYDISVALLMPRSPPNVERGNFMVTLYLLGSEATEKLAADALVFANSHAHFGSQKVLFNSRRPVLVPYVDPIVSVAKRLLFLLYHMFVPSSQTCRMTVALAEGLAFSKGSVLPASAYVEVEAGQDIQIYNVDLTLTAQLRGLRWLMFHYRLPTYLAFTFLFWVCEVLFMGLAWAVWGAVTGPKETGKGRRRAPGEEDDEGELGKISDHPHTFPTYGKQPPLKHEPEVKEEDEERSRLISDIPVGGAEADDEDEYDEYDEGGRTRIYDSGLGTSYSEEGSASVRRRASRNVIE